jgi:hypothetical protein
LLLIKLNEGNGFYLSVKGMANKLNGSGDGKKYLIIRGVKLKNPRRCMPGFVYAN